MDKLAQINFDNLIPVTTNRFTADTKLADLLTGPVGLINFSIFGAAVLLTLYLISGGFQFMVSGGDPKKVEGAKTKITNAFIGLFIVIFAFLIVQFMALLLGLDNLATLFDAI